MRIRVQGAKLFDQNFSNKGFVILFIAVAFSVIGVGDILLKILNGDLTIALLINLIKTGILIGLLIGLAGIGLSLVYSLLQFANFAHGDFISSGAFIGWTVSYLIAGYGMFNIGGLVLIGSQGQIFGSELGISMSNTPLAVFTGLLIAGVVTSGLSLFLYRKVFRAIKEKSTLGLLIASLGVGLVLRYLIVLIYGSSSRATTAPTEITEFKGQMLGGTISISVHDITLFVVTLSTMYLVHYLLQHTKMGMAMRAMADNESLARVRGVPTDLLITRVWLISGFLTGISGYLLVLWRGTIAFNIGWNLLIVIFSAVILGGIGSIYGAIIGGLLIGILMNLSIIWIPPSIAQAITFVIMILFLLLRPKGLLGGRTTI